MLQSAKVNDGGGTKDYFERGEFKISHYDFTVKVFNYCLQFKFEGKLQRNFIKAVGKLIESNKINMDDLITKVNENHNDLTPQPGWKEYLTAFENIFNKGKKIRVVIY